jgi:restriction system protein
MALKPLPRVQCDAIEAGINRLRSNMLDPRGFEDVLGEVLSPLLGQEGFDLKTHSQVRDGGVDFVWTRTVASGALEQIGVEAKYYRQTNRVPQVAVRALVGAAVLRNLDRIVLISNAEFSRLSKEGITRSLPVKIELLGLDDLSNWIERLRVEEEIDTEAEVRIIMREMTQRLARLIAKAPGALAHVEWRDLERIVAEIFEGLGFQTTLTEGSKDGGKDVILTCTVKGKAATYYVEVKHWRSSTRVGASAVEKLLEVVVREKKDGGLFLSTYGFTENAFSQLTTFDRRKLRFGDKDKIVTFCQTYVKAQAGLWSPPEDLSHLLFDDEASLLTAL